MLVTKNTKAGLAAFGTALALLATPAMAQTDRDAAQDAPLVMAQADSFDDATIEGFASAEMAIQEIRATYVPRLDAAESEDERMAIEQEATEAMITAVNDTQDITVDEYNSIVEGVASDPGLAQRVEEELAGQAQ